MKSIVRGLLVVGILAVTSGVLRAEPDAVTVGPDIYAQKLDNENVRALIGTFKPGAKIGMHTHAWGHQVYVAQAGQLTIGKPDGSSQVFDLKADDVLWIPAETHWAQNTGKTTVKLLVTEIKSAAPQSAPAATPASMESMPAPSKKK